MGVAVPLIEDNAAMAVVCGECGAKLEPYQAGLCPVCCGETRVVPGDPRTKVPRLAVVAAVAVTLALTFAGGVAYWWPGAAAGALLGAGLSFIGYLFLRNITRITR